MGAAPDDVMGVEIRANAVALAHELAPKIDVRIYDGINLPFPDSCFDLVTQHVVFSSIPDESLRKQLAGEMTKVLKAKRLRLLVGLPHDGARRQGATTSRFRFIPRHGSSLRDNRLGSISKLVRPQIVAMPRSADGWLHQPPAHPSSLLDWTQGLGQKPTPRYPAIHETT